MTNDRRNTGDEANGAQHRILVVDDSPEVRRALQSHIRSQGHQVECAVNGRCALEMVALEQYDLVLSDIRMPEVDGFELLERLKKEPTTRHIPVIMISGVGDVF